ncbi:hypothetical protein NDA11_004636 [Ustilago hordei]|nr:hypothetical protein NDA11_004636 [Ustilago hordei]UTT94749.1 hypothetical protein NDA17_007541 [Ustilago hordei]
MSSREPIRGSGRGRGRGRGRGSLSSGSRGRGTFAQHRQPRDSGYGNRQHRSSNTNGSDVLTASIPRGSLCCDYVEGNSPSTSAAPSSEPYRCPFRTHSSLALMLHKADRHLIYPEGGIEGFKRHDPMLIAEEREQQRRMRQNQRRNPHPLPSKPSQNCASKQSHDRNDDSSDSDNAGSDSDSGSTTSDDDDKNSASDAGEVAAAQAKTDEANQKTRALDGPADATISGLNIQLNSPELIAEWINQRKKRWPTQDVVKQKLKEKEERQRRSEAIYGPRPQPYGKRPREEAASATRPLESTQNSATAIDEAASAKRLKADSTADETGAKEGSSVDPVGPAEIAAEEDGSDSDDDAPEEVSSKVPALALEEEAPASTSGAAQDNRQDRRPICTHFWQGRCNYGDRCKKRHDTACDSSASSLSGHQQQHRQPLNGPARRSHPRPPPVNPFDQPDLLRQLLRNEIEKHVDAVGQAIRFIVDNDMLLHVETEEAQAEEQRKRRQKIQVLPSSNESTCNTADATSGAEKLEEATSPALPEEPGLCEPLIKGAMAVVESSASDAKRASLYRPPSPTLRPLSELQYPPEPDPLIFLDPLRRDDPKPLMPSQLIRIAKDSVLRSILTPSTPLHPNGHKPASLERAIVSLDALPSDLYRNAAIEMILGIASSNTSSSNPAGGLVVTCKDGRRKVSETDLFRMGLRVGGDEVLAIKKLADRLSVLLDSSLQLDEVGEADWALLSRERRDEMRKLHYEREADRLDRLRKLGIDV